MFFYPPRHGTVVMNPAPIALFAYKRPDHTLRCLKALSRCGLASESVLYIFCDGAKGVSDRGDVERVRDLARSRKWCGDVRIILGERNRGLADSIISGVSMLCDEYGKAIVLEDDLVVSPFFLQYMNDALALYEKTEQVMQISGYMFDVDVKSNTDAFFLPFTTSWGWATWARAWKHFDPSMADYHLLAKERDLRRRFNLDGAYDFYAMLTRQKEGKLDSWAIRWYLSVFITHGLVLYPRKSLVQNKGWDESGVHCGRLNEEEQVDPGFRVRVYPESMGVGEAFEAVSAGSAGNLP